MVDTANATIDSTLKPEPEKPVRLNRKTVFATGVIVVALLFLGVNLGLRGFSGRLETKEKPRHDNLLAMPKTAISKPEITYEEVTRLFRPASKPEQLPGPPAHQTGGQQPSGPNEEQQAAWASPLFPPSALAIRQTQHQEVTEDHLDKTLAKLADLRLPTPENLFSERQPSQTERNEAFLNTDTDDEVKVQKTLTGLKAGSIIPAALITGLNSDLPGQLIGQVTENVFDSVTGQHLLIPQGTKVIGRYNADIAYAQDRLQIVWNRLIMPNGDSVDLGAMVGADKTGAAGLKDSVDHHIPSLIGAIFLSSVISAGANLATDSSREGGFTDDLGDTAAQQAASIGSNIVNRQLNIQPTITVEPGFKLTIIVDRDIALEPYQ